MDLLVKKQQRPPRAKETIIEGLKQWLFKKKRSDVVFHVGPDPKTAKVIHAHSLFLEAQSAVFETMFSGNWRTGKPIAIVDCEAPEFCSLIRWIYCNELIFPPGKLNDVIKLAHKYMVTALIDFIVRNIEKVEKKYILLCHSLAVALELADLSAKCLTIIDSKLYSLLQNDDFVDVSLATIEAIASLDRTSNSYDELRFFTRCLEWAKKECERQELEVSPTNLRKVMEPFIYNISFETMTNAGFARLPFESGVLTAEEQATIFRIKADVAVMGRFRKRVVTESVESIGSVEEGGGWGAHGGW